MDIQKTIVPATGQATDTFTVTLDLSHIPASDADAFDVDLTDVLPAGLNYDGGLVNVSGQAPSTLSQSSGTITATWNTFAVGATLFIDSQDYLGSEGGSIPGNDQLSVTLEPGDTAVDYNFTEAGLRALALSKRSLLASNLGASVTQLALDAAFDTLVTSGLGDLDGDSDTENDDRALFLTSFGGTF